MPKYSLSAGRSRAAADGREGLLGGPELTREGLHDGPADRAVLMDERAELPQREPLADEICRGGDGRHPRALVDQRDLAEVIAVRQCRARLTADRDGRLAGLEHIE